MKAMMKQRMALLVVLGVLGTSLAGVEMQESGAVAIDPDDIGGVVTSAQGPEAGVWVNAETSELATRFIRTVVTDDQGRYLLPDLPEANYEVFVRGYGLVDSARVSARPGQTLNLDAVVAPDPRAAAAVYPAASWLSLMEVPPGELSPEDAIRRVKSCMMCHQLGTQATREIPTAFGRFPSTLDAWDHRVQVGPSGGGMSSQFNGLGPQRAMFADWTDRIVAGEVPEAPPRPTGVERNLVVTQWDWGAPTTFTHTHAASDKRDPTVNPNGRVYGPDRSTDTLMWLDPVAHTTGGLPIPTRDVDMPRMTRFPAASAYWGEDVGLFDGVAQARSSAMDHLGRVWWASRIRAPENQPAFCGSGSTNKFTQYFPIERASTRQVAFYDPRTEEMTLIDTCYTADHNKFGPAPDHTIFFGQTGQIGWINTRIFDETGDEEAAQGWCPGVLDINGDGRITKPWTEPDQPIVPTQDHRITFGCYEAGVGPDGSLWCTGSGTQIVRLELGSDPPATCKAEVYDVPEGGRDARGNGIDSEGVVWVNDRFTDRVISFDRRQCTVLNGPTATGSHCPEGWAVYRKAGPTFRGSSLNSDLNYLITVDTDDTVGLGRDVPMTYAVNSSALIALLPDSGEWVMLRVPYPLGFYTRNAHGRIDDPNAGWKGRGLWSANMSYAIWHIEGEPGTMGGKGQKAKTVKFQFRPDPLAK